MGGEVHFPVKTFQASAAIAQYLRVKLSSGKLAKADAGEECIGTMDAPALAADAYYGVRLWNAQGTRFMVAAGAITQYALVYGADDGKVDDTAVGKAIGIAMEAATADGDIIEVLPLVLDGSAVITHTIDPTAWRTWDAMATNLPGTGANDDLALVTGTPGTDGPTIQSADPGGTTVTAKAGLLYVMPPAYVPGQAVTLRLHAGVLTSVADDSCTIDVSAYEITEAGAAGADLCATAAQSINSLTFADKDFTITPTGLSAGDVLQIIVTIAATDAGNAAAIVPEISRASIRVTEFV